MGGRTVMALAAMLALQGCVARAVADVVTLPVRAVSKGVDLATTSQSEADEKRGREARKAEERIGKLTRQREEAAEDCADGDREACDRVGALGDRIRAESSRPD